MSKLISKAIKLSLLCIFLVLASSVWVLADSDNKPIATDSSGVAIKGYDTVAYFTEGRAIKGKKEFEFSWQGALWYFASAKHRDIFMENPERYAPKFGGYCAGGIIRGITVAANPKNWKIVDGKLYMNYSKRGRDQFHKNATVNIKKAEENWAKLNI